MSPENARRLELLRSAPLDKWIAISADESRIVAAADSFSELSNLIDRPELAGAVILKTPTEWAPLSL
jgi:hypothetical protein